MLKIFDFKQALIFVVGAIAGASVYAFVDFNNSHMKTSASAAAMPDAVAPKASAVDVRETASLGDGFGPPEYYSDLPNPLRTNLAGEVRVAWTPVSGAKQYIVSLEESDGKPIKNYKTNWHVIYLKDVPLASGSKGATYRVRVASVNEKAEQSLFGAERILKVKPQTSIVAPKIQEIKVED